MALYRLRRDISPPFIRDVNKSDARKLVDWWNANTKYYYFIQKQGFGNLYNIIKII